MVKDSPPRKLDETIPGGRYLAGGVLVDANGTPLPPPTTTQETP